MEVKIPKPNVEVVEKGLGKQVLNAAYQSMEDNNSTPARKCGCFYYTDDDWHKQVELPPPPAAIQQEKVKRNLIVNADHLVDETDEVNKQHKIITVHQGEEVLLMGGAWERKKTFCFCLIFLTWLTNDDARRSN